MSRQNPPPTNSSAGESTLYFAYGSNLSLSQMANRCPNSKYMGRAILDDYKWIINERRYANIVPAPGHRVEGLVFELGGDDEKRLDRSEGVSKGAYGKENHVARVYLSPTLLYRVPTVSIIRDGGPESVIDNAKCEGKDVTENMASLEMSVLVYVDGKRVGHGSPWEEYVGRIKTGVVDAVALGVDSSYFSSSVLPLLLEKEIDTHVS